MGLVDSLQHLLLQIEENRSRLLVEYAMAFRMVHQAKWHSMQVIEPLQTVREARVPLGFSVVTEDDAKVVLGDSEISF